MALLWQRQYGGNHYQVRTAGRTRRLYTNGVCHTEYNPDRAITRSIWDLLFLPALFRPSGTIRRVLVLGVGGGCVLHLLRRHLQPEQIIGIELSSIHLSVAKRFFNLRDRRIELHAADAAVWLQDCQEPKFDLIIDDLFLEEGSVAMRAVDCDAAWFRLLLRHLSRDGLLVINFPDNKTFRQCAWFSHKAIRRRLSSGFVFRTPYLDNAVAAFMRFPVETADLRRQIQIVPALAQAARARQLRYRVRKLPEVRS